MSTLALYDYLALLSRPYSIYSTPRKIMSRIMFCVLEVLGLYRPSFRSAESSPTNLKISKALRLNTSCSLLTALSYSA